MGHHGREVATGASHDPAAQRGELERLREVAEGESGRTKLVLERGAERPGLDSRGARYLVDLEHPVERAKVDAHGPGVVIADAGLDAADDAGPTAERDGREAGVRAPREHALHVGLVARMSDDVGRIGELAAEAAHDVAIGLAHRVRGALVRVGRADLRQRLRGIRARLAQLDPVEGHRLGDVLAPEPEALTHLRNGRLDLLPCEPGRLRPPAPVAAPVAGGYHVPTSGCRASGTRRRPAGSRACRCRPAAPGQSPAAEPGRRPRPASSPPSRRSNRGTGGRRC